MNEITIEPIVFQEKNLWELEMKDEYIFANTIEEVLELIKQNKLTLNYIVKNKYIPGNETNNRLDSIALKNNIIINYTDDNHNLALSENYPTFINPTFLKKYEKELKEAFTNQIKESNKTYFTINKFIFSNELFEFLINKEKVTLYFEDVVLTDEQINKLRDRFIDAYIKLDGKNKKISSKYAFEFYTKDQLAEMDKLNIYLIEMLKENNILNLKYLKENATINISLYDNFLIEEEKLKLIQEKLIQLNSVNKKFNVKFKVDKRSIYNKLFKNLNLNNLNIIIENDLYEYSEDEYKKEDEKLDNLVSNIKNSNLSPFEKYIAVYNIVKNIKPYKENEENKEEARNLRYIIDNEYIVCRGYAVLLIELLDKVGINANDYSVSVDTSYDDGFTEEEKVVEYGGHARVIVNIDDDKYNIHGLYVSDPTWDNDLEKNYLNNALLTFDSMQQDKRMFFYTEYMPVLDIHNFKEYNKQVNYLLKRQMEYLDTHNQNDSYSKILIESYKDVAINILNTIKCDPKYTYFIKKLSTCNVEKDFIVFYTELGHYLLTKINIKVDEKKVLEANKQVIQTLYNNIDVEKFVKMTQEDFYDREPKQFPYTIPSDNEFNLEDNIKSK